MIVFEGEVSEKERDLAVRITNRIMLWIGIIAPLPFVAVTIYVGVCVDYIYLLFLLTYVAFSVIWVFFVKPGEKDKGDITPIKVEIDDEHVIKETTKNYNTYRVDEVKRVEDYGDFYRIIFYFPHCDRFCICQKDLITQGTIEEFEEMFAGYIVKKQLKK